MFLLYVFNAIQARLINFISRNDYMYIMDNLYPSPSFRDAPTRKTKTLVTILLAFILGVMIGGFNFNYPKNEHVYVLDPVLIPKAEEIENNLETFSIELQGQEELNFSYWTEDKDWDLYIHTHNTTITEFYFDQDLRIVTKRSYTFVVHEPFDLLLIISQSVTYITFWFWEN